MVFCILANRRGDFMKVEDLIKKLKQEIEENGFAFISPWIYELSGYLMFSRGEFQESIGIVKHHHFLS
jgi:hypothetical protein